MLTLMTRTRAALAALPLLALPLTACGGGGSSEKTTTATAPSPAANSNSSEGQAASTIPLGKPAQGDEGMTFTVDSVQELSAIPYGARDASGETITKKAPAGQHFIQVNGTFANKGTAPAMAPSMGQLTTTTGKSYTEDDSAGLVSADSPQQPATNNLSPEVNPGSSTKFVDIFLVPASEHAATIPWPDSGIFTLKLTK